MSFWGTVTGTTSLAPRPQAPSPAHLQQPFQTAQSIQPMPSPYQQPQGYQQPLEDPAVESAKRRASSSRSTLTCPNCFSDNVCKPSANIMEQCYTCGWNPRFEQSTAGAGMPTSGETGPTQASRQVSTANNFNPQTIVAKVT